MPPLKQPLGEASVEIVARLDRLDKDFAKARKTTEAASKKMSLSFGQLTSAISRGRAMLGTFMAGLAVVGGAAGIGLVIKRNLDFVDSLDKVSSKLGVSTDFLQQAQYAASQSGIEFNTLSMAMQRFTRRAGEANKGLGEARDAIKELGIQLTDANGRMRSTEDLFADAMAALARIDDPADRLRLAFKLFDSEGAVLVNLADNFETLSEKATAMGLIVDESIIKRGVQAKDELDTLSKVIRANLAGTLVDLAPVLIGVGQHLSYVARWAAEAWARLSDVLNLQPTGIEAMRDRVGELKREISSVVGQVEMWKQTLGPSAQFVESPDTLRLSALREELRLLEERIAGEETRLQRTQADVAAIADPEELTAKFQDLSKERDRLLDQWVEEANVVEEQWDSLSDSAAASMSRMVADGEISFRALGQAFVHEFTERVLRSLVFNQIFQALGSLIGSAGHAVAPEYNLGGGGQLPTHIGDYKLDTGLPPGMLSSTPNIQIINATSAPVQTQSLFGGDTRVFIGQQGAQDILMGGDMAQAIENRYGVSARGVRK